MGYNINYDIILNNIFTPLLHLYAIVILLKIIQILMPAYTLINKQ